MKIEPQYVTFEQAKLLDTKGFDIQVRDCYHNEDLIHGGAWYNHNNKEEQKQWNLIKVSAPEIWQVVEWFLLNHKTYIQVVSFNTSTCMKFEYQIKRFEWDGKISDSILYDSPKEAYSAAIDYVLKNLI